MRPHFNEFVDIFFVELHDSAPLTSRDEPAVLGRVWLLHRARACQSKSAPFGCFVCVGLWILPRAGDRRLQAERWSGNHLQLTVPSHKVDQALTERRSRATSVFLRSFCK